MAKKNRTQYNWKFKETESQEFIEWFENQDNISNSLRSILYHIIELYGTGDFLEPSVQRKLYIDTFTLESLKNKSQSNHNFDLIDLQQQGVNNTVLPPVKQEVAEVKPESIKLKDDDTVGVSQNHSNDFEKQSTVEKKSNLFGKIEKDLL